MPKSQERTCNDRPLVSVVIPTCNRDDILERCLSALTRQTYSRFEVIVVDDASTDTTPDLLKRFAEDNPSINVQVIRNERHAGANPSRNRGISAAKGELVAFEDSDCVAEPEWIEELVAGFTDERVAAVTGLITDVPPRNIFELTFKGTHRLSKAGPARRLIAGNMCVRRELLLRFSLDEDRASQPVDATGSPDVTVSGRGDEEGLFLMLRAAGYRQFVVPRAVVLHDHHLTGRSFFRQALRGGRSAARLVYKYYLPPRLDLLTFVLAYATLPLGLFGARLLILPVGFFALAVAAISYNDVARKGKRVGEWLWTLPILLAYYHVRLFGYATEWVALRSGRRRLTRKRLGGASPTPEGPLPHGRGSDNSP